MSSINSRPRDRDAAHVGAGPSTLGRLLVLLGFDAVIIDGVLGDLTEERARRRDAHGVLRASAWYAREVARSLPHWVVAGFRRGDAFTRMRIAGVLALIMSIATSALIAYLSRDGSPASIVLGGSDPIDGVVVNYTEPTMLQTNVLDDRGHRLSNERVEFHQISGAPLALSPTGVLHCTGNTDATVRATARGVDANLIVHCRPVRELRVSDWVDFIVGDAPRDLPFVAIGVDGRPVTTLRGVTTIGDSSVAALEGAQLRPRMAGETDLIVAVGNRTQKMRVFVHAPVASFATLRDDQKHVAIPVRLARGDTLSFALPAGVFWLKYLSRVAGEPPPTIELHGGATCGAGDGLREYRVVSDAVMTYCVVERTGATVVLAHGAFGLPVVAGSLALDRVAQDKP